MKDHRQRESVKKDDPKGIEAESLSSCLRPTATTSSNHVDDDQVFRNPPPPAASPL